MQGLLGLTFQSLLWFGATTRAGSLTTPLRDRFGIVSRLELYNTEELTEIVTRSAKILEIDIEKDAAIEIARRSRGTPRIANRILKRVRDYALVLGNGDITLEIAKIALNKLDIDEIGLDEIDRKVLKTMIEKYKRRTCWIRNNSCNNWRRSRYYRRCIWTIFNTNWIYVTYTKRKNCFARCLYTFGIYIWRIILVCDFKEGNDIKYV